MHLYPALPSPPSGRSTRPAPPTPASSRSWQPLETTTCQGRIPARRSSSMPSTWHLTGRSAPANFRKVLFFKEQPRGISKWPTWNLYFCENVFLLCYIISSAHNFLLICHKWVHYDHYSWIYSVKHMGSLWNVERKQWSDICKAWLFCEKFIVASLCILLKKMYWFTQYFIVHFTNNCIYTI